MVNYKAGGKRKEYLRKKIINIIKHNRPKTIFTLPNLNFSIEKYAISRGSKVVCCEIDKDIYNKQLGLKPKDVELHNDLMSNVIKDRVFDLAWLDACGPISKELLSSVENLNVSDGGDVIITVGRAREHYNYKLGDRDEYYVNLLSRKGYFPYEIYYYKDYIFPMAAIFCKKGIKTENIVVYAL